MFWRTASARRLGGVVVALAIAAASCRPRETTSTRPRVTEGTPPAPSPSPPLAPRAVARPAPAEADPCAPPPRCSPAAAARRPRGVGRVGRPLQPRRGRLVGDHPRALQDPHLDGGAPDPVSPALRRPDLPGPAAGGSGREEGLALGNVGIAAIETGIGRVAKLRQYKGSRGIEDGPNPRAAGRAGRWKVIAGKGTGSSRRRASKVGPG